jgi:hypothetical protein
MSGSSTTSANFGDSYVRLGADDRDRDADRAAMWSPPVDLNAGQRRVDSAESLESLDGGRRRGSSSSSGKGSFSSSVFNLTNTILGSGTLAMPYVCRVSGVFLFVTMLFLTALGADLAVRLLFEAVEKLNLARPRYPTLGHATYGRLGEQVAMWSVTLQQMGACIAYVVIVGDVLAPIADLSGVKLLQNEKFVKVRTAEEVVACNGRWEVAGGGRGMCDCVDAARLRGVAVLCG